MKLKDSMQAFNVPLQKRPVSTVRNAQGIRMLAFVLVRLNENWHCMRGFARLSSVLHESCEQHHSLFYFWQALFENPKFVDEERL